MAALTAIGYLAALCVTLAVVLAIAQRTLYVEEDPRIDDVTDLLPGANCGACGLPGCRAFAEQLVGGAVQPGECTVSDPDARGTIASYLGIEVGSVERRVARLLCAGGEDVAGHAGAYAGFSSCRAAATIAGGPKECTYGCLRLADCREACTFDAITMGPSGLPVVDLEKCTACGDCVDACPKGLFVIMPARRRLLVQCRSLLEGDAALATCNVACTGCGLCAADAPEGLIRMEHGLPVIQPERWELETPIATLRCPTGAIAWVEGQQFPEDFEQMNPTSTRVRDAVQA
jgi:Na+-translocating ferredoxin:NAD+ oxidoreductase RNF subunit RnfB